MRQQRLFPFKLFNQKKAIKPCFKARCKACGKLIHHSNFVKSKVNQRCYPVRASENPMTCQSSRLVYLLQCSKCQQQYVQQTTQPLHVRMNHHVSNIQRTTYTSPWWHFNKDHTIEDLRVIPLQQVDDKLPVYQAEKELQDSNPYGSIGCQ